MAVRRLDGIDDELRFPAGGTVASLDAVTIALLVRPTVLTDALMIQLHSASGHGTGYGVELDDTGGLALWNGEISQWTGRGHFTAGQWVLIVVTKGAGSAVPRVHTWDGRSWATPINLGRAMDSGYAVVGGHLRIGNWEGDYRFSGDYAAVGIWPAALDDAQVESLAATTLTAWTRVGSPASVWLFDQASTSTAVVDLVGGNDQSAITGTTVIDEAPPVPYQAAAGVTIAVHDGAGWVDGELLAHDGAGWVPAAGLEVL